MSFSNVVALHVKIVAAHDGSYRLKYIIGTTGMDGSHGSIRTKRSLCSAAAVTESDTT